MWIPIVALLCVFNCIFGCVSLLQLLATCLLVFVLEQVRLARNYWKRHCTHSTTASCIGFVHPNAYGGGGGERVLWVALEQLITADMEKGIERCYVVYSGTLPEEDLNKAEKVEVKKDTTTGTSVEVRTPLKSNCFKDAIVQLAEKQFGGSFKRRIEIVELHPWTVKLQNPKYYPRLTLILQSLVGGVLLGLDVVFRCGSCDLLVDSVGIAFAYPIFRYIGGCKVAAYVHYPTVSSDMISRVEKRDATGMYNNSSTVAKSSILSGLKVIYYKAFAIVYRWMGTRAHVIMTNSSWTNDHIQNIWGDGGAASSSSSSAFFKSTIVFPPVNVSTFRTYSLDDRTNNIVSIGQFRPEKNHMLQIESFAAAIENGGALMETKDREGMSAEEKASQVNLYLVGGARNAEDRARVAELEAEITRRKLNHRIFLEVSVPFPRITELLATSAIGLHSMLDEHFGIVVVEYLAAGCVALAHNSGGVKADIVDQPMTNGLLAATKDEFANGIISLVNLKRKYELEQQAQKNKTDDGTLSSPSPSLLPCSWREMQNAGRKKAAQFSDEEFGQYFTNVLEPVLKL